MFARRTASALLLLPLLLVAATATSCVEADRPFMDAGAADSTEVSDGEADTGAEDTSAGDTGLAECGPAAPCPALGPCLDNVCVSGTCVRQDANDGDRCDDLDPCTGQGRCGGGLCNPGNPVADGVRCDDDELVCNGGGVCVGGECVIEAAPVCPSPAHPCRAAVCSEEAGGCAVVPANEGGPCSADSDSFTGTCSEGLCVPPGMVGVPAGVFTMGCDAAACLANSKPAHAVTLSSYAIDAYEITNGQFSKCVTDDAGSGLSCPLGTLDLSNVNPYVAAAGLTWSQADAVCRYYGKRLCTEAEWEKAARGVDQRMYPWGDNPATCELAVMWEVGADKGACGAGEAQRPGTRLAGDSPYGVSDMAGNVAEWVFDYYDPNIYEALANHGEAIDPVVDTALGAYPNSRILRGGSWKDQTLQLRSTRRNVEIFSIFDDDTGARCCLALE